MGASINIFNVNLTIGVNVKRIYEQNCFEERIQLIVNIL